MKTLFSLLLMVVATSAFGQINLDDSSAQVITYWSLGEKQSYFISQQKIKLNGTDTTENVLVTYYVDILVLDSTANSFLVEWNYRNFSSNASNELFNKLSFLSEGLKIQVELDEVGIFQGVKNWEEVGTKMKQSLKLLQKEFEKNEEFATLINQFEAKFSSKEAIENALIQDIQQFHTFHGGKYILGEVLEFEVQTPNLFNLEKPLDSKLTLSLDEMNADENNYLIRSSQEVDSKQLTDATFEYLKSMSKNMKGVKIKKEDLGELHNITNTASLIHDSGWVVYSILTKTVEAPGNTVIEERTLTIE